MERFVPMKDHACFRVSVAQVASDFAKYADLARTRTFEIWDEGRVDVLLVRIDAVRDWYNQLQIAVPAALTTDEELESILRQMPTSDEIEQDRWMDEVNTPDET